MQQEQGQRSFQTPPTTSPKNDSTAYAINVFGRQVAGPAVGIVTRPIVSKWLSTGIQEMNTDQLRHHPHDAMFNDWWGQWFAKNHTSNGNEGIDLRRSGAAWRGKAFTLVTLPSAMRLALNLGALTTANLEHQNKTQLSILAIDTASNASVFGSTGYCILGLRHIAKGNEALATPLLQRGELINVFSTATQIVVGALRLSEEIERQKNGAPRRFTAIYSGCLDISDGLRKSITSAYLLFHLRQMKKKDPSLSYRNRNNILLSLMKLPSWLQVGSQLISALSAATILGVNVEHVARDVSIATSLGQSLSDACGVTGAAVALFGAFMLRPATFGKAMSLYGWSAVFIGIQTIHDLWPFIESYLHR